MRPIIPRLTRPIPSNTRHLHTAITSHLRGHTPTARPHRDVESLRQCILQRPRGQLRHLHISSAAHQIQKSQNNNSPSATGHSQNQSSLTSDSHPSSSTGSQHQIEGATDLSHAHFISSALPTSDFNPSQTPNAGQNLDEQDLSTLSTSPSVRSPNGAGETSLSEWQGKLSPTSSHLFKLLIPLPTSSDHGHGHGASRQTAFLLHPSQPLSHLSRLIIGSLPKTGEWVDCEINYMSVTGEAKDLDSHLRHANELEEQNETQQFERQEGGPYLNEREEEKGRFQEVSWSQSTDLSDFIKQSCLNEKFKIVINKSPLPSTADDTSPTPQQDNELVLEVIIPSFASRTHYIRQRLLSLTKELDKMTKQKKNIDYKAHKGAQKLAVAALGGGVVYWAAVIRWTFFTDAGWDLMEPVTWATGFAALLGSAAFLIYHNREVSYSSLLDLSITARQRKLYDEAGLDIEKWTEMVSEAKTLRREITRIASDYDIEWKGELENLNEKKANAKSNTSSNPSLQSRTKAFERGPHLQAKANSTANASASASTSASADLRNEEKKERSETGEKKEIEQEEQEQEQEEEEEEKIDIDKTIEEASELAEQSEEKRSKEKAAQRKGEPIDSKEGGDGGAGDRGSRARTGQEKESDSEIQGKKRAKEIIDK
ncbi:uncharacterized protein I303_104211 [Kwoniella dejecticola CBS 10117]|uniref:Calcium uniporter protein, mitochondrial n=1 Tax=Kwoniella dejecticola CBS 10117 TaxID=1296121 RepID=A0A1A6A5Y9_9TREE|nr:uncharacterized protein I303_04813 [Kwoniella dejecticola CBS 10117]OBR85477.1 hypothetical protein I303_04813 [Kwoniella dejecticola CBS 10117]